MLSAARAVRVTAVVSTLTLVACAPPPGSPPMEDGGAPDDAHTATDAAATRDAGADTSAASDAGADTSAPDASRCEDEDGDGDPDLACGGGDCDDADATRSSLASEVCSGATIDEDCDGRIDEGVEVALHDDADHDGYGTPASTTMGCPGADLVADGTDCDDTRADVSPGASELCGNAVDDDCDASVDELGPTTFYLDADGDGFGVAGTTMLGTSCTPPTGYAANAADCDDLRYATHPGSTSDPCNGLDDDCALGVAGGGVDPREDADGDRHGNPTACRGSSGWPPDDCDDTQASVHPGASEICNRIDDDCSSGGGVAPEEDVDDDGYAPRFAARCNGGFPTTDCNDAVATIHPDAPELCNRIDDDCSNLSTIDTSAPAEDQDRDLHAPIAAACTGGYPKDDCNDAVATTYPGAPEVCNAVDDDCSNPGGSGPAPGGPDRSEDQDADFYAPASATCTGGYPKTDCDDTRASFHPGAPTQPPRVLAPAIGTRSASARPTFRWASTGDACVAAPTWEISADDSCPSATTCSIFMASPEVRATGLTSTTYAAATSLATGRSYYHVRECTPTSGCGPWSVIRWIDVGRVANDLNGDGHADLAVGAPDFIDGNGWHGGRVYVYYGTASGLPATPSLTIDPPWSPIVAEQRFGSSVAIGDLTGDGIGDLAVGAVGSVYLYPGSASGLSTSSPSSGNVSTTATSVSVAVVGDVQGDGYEDLAVGVRAPGDESVTVFYGDASGLSGSGDVQIESPTRFDEPDAGFGASVAGAGDVDGDGYLDVIVGAPGSDATAHDAGRAYVFRGGLYDLSAYPDLTLDPPTAQAGAGFGASVAGADLDADGFSDLVIGAPTSDGVRTGEGRVVVFRGNEVLARVVSSLALDAPGDEAGARFGASIAIGDVTGDGVPDLAVGAPGADGTLVDAGRAFVYAGSASGLASAPVATLGDASGTTGAALGSALAVIGDVDGDGTLELAVGAPLDGGVATSAGATLVFRGAALTSGPWIGLDDPARRAGDRFGAALARAGTPRGDLATAPTRSAALAHERRRTAIPT